MSDELPERPQADQRKHPRSFVSFWRHGFNKARKRSWDSYGNALIFFTLVYAVGAVCLHFPRFKEYASIELWGLDMSTWVQVIIPSILLFGFLAYHFLRAPYEIYKEHFEKSHGEIEMLELELKKQKEIKPLEIRPLPVKNTPRNDGIMLSEAGGATVESGAQLAQASECHIEIYNPNQGVDVVRVRILKIDPPMPSRVESVTTDDCNLRALYFPFTDIPDESLNTASSGDICIFKIVRTPQVIIVRFEGKWNDTCQNSFAPKNEHFITIQVVAKATPPKDYLFKMSFSLDPTRPAFILREINAEELMEDKQKAQAIAAEKSKNEKMKFLHDSLDRLQVRKRFLNGANRYFELTGEHKRATLELIMQIDSGIYEMFGPGFAAIFTGSKSTQKGLGRFGSVANQYDLDWMHHLDYIDAHIDSLLKIIEKQL